MCALYTDALGKETVTHPDVVLCREAQAEVASTP